MTADPILAAKGRLTLETAERMHPALGSDFAWSEESAASREWLVELARLALEPLIMPNELGIGSREFFVLESASWSRIAKEQQKRAEAAETALAEARRQIAERDEALKAADAALCEYACMEPWTPSPCLRSDDECNRECGRPASEALAVIRRAATLLANPTEQPEPAGEVEDPNISATNEELIAQAMAHPPVTLLKRGDVRVINGIRSRFVELDDKGEVWEIMGDAPPSTDGGEEA